MIILAIVLCVYLLFIRSSVLYQRYPLFYSYLLLSCGFELLLSIGPLNVGLGAPPRIMAYQLIYLFQLYLLAYLWREVLQRDYPSLRLMVYLLMVLASLATLIWYAQPFPGRGLSWAVNGTAMLSGLAAPSFFAALLLVITFKEFRIPVPRPLRGIIYGLTLLTGFDFLAIFISYGQGFIAGYDRVFPWLASLVLYCTYLTTAPAGVYRLSLWQPAMLVTNPQLLNLDQKIFYHFMVKTRLYNPITEACYYRYCSPILLDSTPGTPTLKAHFQRLYARHQYPWAGAYYRIVDRLILSFLRNKETGDLASDFKPLESRTEAPPPVAAPPGMANSGSEFPLVMLPVDALPASAAASPGLDFSSRALAPENPERRPPQI